MKRTILTMTILTTALAATLSCAAQAATPRAQNVVRNNVITVGDVFDDAGAHAGRYLAPAPAPGAAMVLTTRDLSRISDAFGLGWHPVTHAETATLTRYSNDILRQDVEKELVAAIAERLNTKNIEVELSAPLPALRLPEGHEKTLALRDLRIDLNRNRFEATVTAPAENPVITHKVAGNLHTLVRVPVLSTPLRNGDLIRNSDIQHINMRTADVSANVIVDAARLTGMTPRRGIPALRPVTESDLQPPLVVKKGDLVTVTMTQGQMNLILQGRALENGAQGDTVRIVNMTSNRTIEGIITGPQTAAIAPAS